MRIDLDTWGLQLAMVCSSRSTCLRRSVGCVLVDKNGHVLSTGYNGVAKGEHHCNEKWTGQIGPASGSSGYPHACPGALSPSGTNLDGCHAIHAEQNALLQCRDPMAIHTCYVTTSPCVTCVKLLTNTSCTRIVFGVEYPQPEAKRLWLGSPDREWLEKLC